jgi:hypothetical protein
MKYTWTWNRTEELDNILTEYGNNGWHIVHCQFATFDRNTKPKVYIIWGKEKFVETTSIPPNPADTYYRG